MKQLRLLIVGLMALLVLPVLIASCDDAPEGIRYRTTTFAVGDAHWRNDVSSDDKAVITNLINRMIKVEACHFFMGGQSRSFTRANFIGGFSTRDTIWNRFGSNDAYWRDLKSQDTIWYDARDFNFVDTFFTKRDTVKYANIYKTGCCWVGPVIEVTMPDFYIGKFEITQREWTAVMHKDPTGRFDMAADKFDRPQYSKSWYEEFGLGDNYPAYNIWYSDAVDFCKELSDITGLNFRLPTEAEWECAARGGKYCRGYKYAGSDEIEDAAWYYYNTASTGLSEDEETDFGTHPVGKKLANELGLYDMSGNVSEWVANAYYPYKVTDCNNPQGKAVLGNGQDTLILRGGSWMQKKNVDFSMANRKYCIMSSYSSEDSRQSAFANCGFRICISK